MNKIKTFKIKNEDGSLSDESYSLAVDARNVEMSNGNSAQDIIGDIDITKEKNIKEQLTDINGNIKTTNEEVAAISADVKKKAYFFNTVAEMKNAKLKAGDYAVTLGYYEANDGGGGDYLIRVKSKDDVEDNGSVHFIGNNLVAKLIIKNLINVKQFGAKGDGITDDTLYIQRSINYCLNNLYKLFIPSGTYIVSNELIIDKSSIEIEGIKNKTIIKLVSDDPKILLNIKQPTSMNLIKNITFNGVNYLHTGLRISGNHQAIGYTGANWKNTFSECVFGFFKIGLIITTDRNKLDGATLDFASENYFEHCKFKNNRTHCVFENYQSLNNLFLQTDFENEKDKDDSSFPMMINRSGGQFKFDTCSIMGAGMMYKIENPINGVNLFPDHAVTFENCRLEIYPNHNGNLIYQDEGKYGLYKQNFIYINNMKLYFHSNVKLNILNYAGWLFADINGIHKYGNGGSLYICENTIAGSSNNLYGNLSSITVKNITGRLFYEKGTRSTAGKPYQSTINYKNALRQYNNQKDSLNFRDLTGSINFSRYNQNFNNVDIKDICIIQPDSGYAIDNLKFILPKDLYLLKFYVFKQGTRYTYNTTFNLYMVKNNANWADPTTFNKDTDAVLISTITDTLNKSGYFESNIVLNENYGNDCTTGNMNGYTEGRYYIEIPSENKTSGIVGIKYI